MLQWGFCSKARFSFRWKTQQCHLAVSKPATLKAGLGQRDGEKEKENESMLGGSFILVESVPTKSCHCPSLCSLTTYYPRHPCHFGNAATQTWLLALESHWSLKDKWVRMEDSCGGEAWEVLWRVSCVSDLSKRGWRLHSAVSPLYLQVLHPQIQPTAAGKYKQKILESSLKQNINLPSANNYLQHFHCMRYYE